MKSHPPLDFETMPDNDVLEYAIKGDKDAFSVLYQRNVNRIYSYIYYRTGNTHDAEGSNFESVSSGDGTHSELSKYRCTISAWLYRIAHNLVANWHRDNKRKNEVALEDHEMYLAHGEMPESQVVTTQEKELLLKGIRNLSDERQQLIILKFVEKLSNSEVALIMGRSEGAVKSLYHRTLMSLRDEFKKLENQDFVNIEDEANNTVEDDL